MLKGILSIVPQKWLPRHLRKKRLDDSLQVFIRIWHNFSIDNPLFNTALFDETVFLRLQCTLISEMRSNKDLITPQFIIQAMSIAVIAYETYQDSLLLNVLVDEFTLLVNDTDLDESEREEYLLNVLKYLTDIQYIHFLKKICEQFPISRSLLLKFILSASDFKDMLVLPEFVELMCHMEQSDYGIHVEQCANNHHDHVEHKSRFLLEIAVKIADFGNFEMLLYILRHQPFLNNISNEDVCFYHHLYLIKAVLKCAEYDKDFAMRLLENPCIPLQKIRKTRQSFQGSNHHQTGEILFFLLAHFWVNVNTCPLFKHALKAAVLSRTSDSIDLEVEIEILSFNADDLAFASAEIHNYPHSYTRERPVLSENFQRYMNTHLLVCNFGEKNPALIDLVINSRVLLSKVVSSAIISRRLSFVHQLLNLKGVTLRVGNPLSDAFSRNCLVRNELVYLALLDGNKKYDSSAGYHLPPTRAFKIEQVQTKLSRIRERLRDDRRTFICASLACGRFPKDLQSLIFSYVYPWLTPRHLQSGPAIVHRFKLNVIKREQKERKEALEMEEIVGQLRSCKIF